MISMTGFGAAERSVNGAIVTAEISSVNRKQAELRIRLPKELSALEQEFRTTILARVARGSVQARIELVRDPNAAPGAMIDRKLAEAIVRDLRRLKSELGLAGDVTLQELLAIPNANIVSTQSLTTDELADTARTALNTALEKLIATRRQEGAAIRADFEKRHQELVRCVDALEQRAHDMPRKARDDFRARLAELLGDVTIDEDRLLREAAIMADRLDVTEEITRLRAHLEQLAGLWNQVEPVGRRMDFLLQECFREINTIGSKTNELDISRVVIDVKTELEKIREQAQNIE